MEYCQKYLFSCLRAIPAVATSFFTRKVRGNRGVRARTLLRLTARLAAMIPFAALLCSPSPASAQVPLGAAESFAVLGGSTVTNTGATIITGNVGVSPGTAITGFLPTNTIQGVPPGTVTAGPGIVNGTIYAGGVGAAHAAQTDAAFAYDSLVFLGQGGCNFTYAAVAEIGGLTLAPGVHCLPSSAFLTGTLFLDAGGDPNAVFVFLIGSTLITAVNSAVVMSNGGQDTNVFWQVGSSATLGTGTSFTGNILAFTSITLTAGASVSGRAFALNGAVTMDTNNVASTCSSSSTDCAHPLPVPPRGRDVTQLLIDHYQCYSAGHQNKSMKRQVLLEDQFGKRTVTVERPLLICAPAVKDANPQIPPVAQFPRDLRNPIDHFVCYEISEKRGHNKYDDDWEGDDESSDNGRRGGHAGRRVLVENQFGQQRLSVEKPQLLCVPSLKTLR